MNLLDLAETIYGSRPDLTPDQAEADRTAARAYLERNGAADLVAMLGVDA